MRLREVSGLLVMVNRVDSPILYPKQGSRSEESIHARCPRKLPTKVRALHLSIEALQSLKT